MNRQVHTKTRLLDPLRNGRGFDGAPFWLSSLIFGLLFVLLSSVVNVRYPGPAPHFWFLLPSLDVAALCVVFALVGWTGWQLPRWSLAAIAVALVVVRVLRLADGISMRYMQRELNLYVDAPLLFEFGVLMRQTQPASKLLVMTVLLSAGLVGLGLLVYFALRFVSARLKEGRFQLVLAGLLAFGVLLWPLRQTARHEDHYLGPFAASVVPRIVSEASFLLNGERYVEERSRTFERAQADLARIGTDLAALDGADVYLIFVESYGSTLFERGAYRSELLAVWRRMESAFQGAGIGVASRFLDSPTYGGFSWRAHQTLVTGVRVENELDHDLLMRREPKSLAAFLRGAGYRTVLVQPGTIRSFEPGTFSEFDAKYAARSFGYRGPKYGWATMPDQYVLDFIERNEVARAMTPLFAEIALISSHGPWSLQPPLVADWSKLQDGSIFHRLPSLRYDTDWTNLAGAERAYLRSIQYVLDVLQGFIVERVSRDALFIVLGDHQPPAPLTDNSRSYAVPIHLISRRAALVEPFLEEGYTAGMIPSRGAPKLGMEHFLPRFLGVFSRASTRGGVR